MRKFIFTALFLFLISRIIGLLLDDEANRVVDQLYARNADGIVEGAKEINFVKNHDKALILIHGHLDTPEIWHEIYEKAIALDKFDIYAPLLPYHGRDLRTAKNLDNEVVSDYLEEYIKDKSSKYKEVTVVGLSYGGLHLVNLALQEKLASNTQLILSSPAYYIFANTGFAAIRPYLFKYLFREYCNYTILTCNYAPMNSVDDSEFSIFMNNITLRYRVMSAIIEMFEMDRSSRGNIRDLKIPFTLIMSDNDQRVDYKKIYEDCTANNNCEFVLISKAGHVIHHGEKQDEWFQVVKKKLINS